MNIVKHLLTIDNRVNDGSQKLVLPVGSRFLSLGPDTWGNPVVWFAQPSNVEMDEWTIKQAYPGNSPHVGRDDQYLGVIVEDASTRHFFATVRELSD